MQSVAAPTPAQGRSPRHTSQSVAAPRSSAIQENKMIQPQTLINVADNTGARTLMCIRVLQSSRQYAHLGDIIVGVVKDALPNGSVKKSDVVKAVIVRTSQGTRRQNGMTLRFDENAGVIINDQNNPKGTRVFGPIARELREKNFSKIVSLANEVL